MVSVTYRDLVGIRRTLASVADRLPVDDGEIEFLVIDGATPNIEDVAQEFPWAEIRSAPDLGIYDAMNKGIAAARGTHIWFLNGGDQCIVADWRSLRSVLVDQPAVMLLGDYQQTVGVHVISRATRGIEYIWHALPTSHQAIFYPRTAIGATRYDLSYPVSADYQFTAQLVSQGVPARRIFQVVASFALGGTSTIRARQVARDAGRVHREILHSSIASRALSQVRHLVSRTLSRLSARRTLGEDQ